MIEVESVKDWMNIIVILGSLEPQMDGNSFPCNSKAKNQLDKRVCTMRGLFEATVTDSLKMAGDRVVSRARKEKGIAFD